MLSYKRLHWILFAEASGFITLPQALGSNLMVPMWQKHEIQPVCCCKAAYQSPRISVSVLNILSIEAHFHLKKIWEKKSESYYSFTDKPIVGCLMTGNTVTACPIIKKPTTFITFSTLHSSTESCCSSTSVWLTGQERASVLEPVLLSHIPCSEA